MELQITRPGAFKPDGKELAVGEVIKIDADKIPSYLLGKVRQIVDGNVEVVTAAVEGTRVGRFVSLALQVGKFTKDGKPDLNFLNGVLNPGEKKFTAEERDTLLPALEAEIAVDPAKAPKTFVVATPGDEVGDNPPPPSGAERQERLKELTEGLPPESLKEGKPTAEVVNTLLNEGETPFTDEEITKLTASAQ